MDHFATPIFRFPEDSPFRNIVIKREDLSETGSHKFRYLKSQMEELKNKGVDRVVLSTTGNVGITASHYGKKLGVKVFCLMSEQSDMARAAQVEQEGGFLVLSSRPKRWAEYISKKYSVPLLRASREEEAVEGYRSLGQEILEQVPETPVIVNFATSGTSSIGLMRAYKKLPALHIAHDDEIVREDELKKLVEQSGGGFHIITSEEKTFAEKILQEYGLETSDEGVASFAVALKIKDQYPFVVVIFSGKKWPEGSVTGKKADTLEEIDTLWSLFSIPTEDSE